MTALPAFPTDPGTLDAIEEALRHEVSDTRAAALAESDEAADAEDVRETWNLDATLELMSGWTTAGRETVHRGGVIVDTGPLYSREDVILALIQEVRELRGAVERWGHAWATAAGQLAPEWPEAPA